ncbi:MAG: transposase family protein [Candidatus Competibacteraceae bacterium]|nr:transposase family protein [Candidatus Competibacteraceae bacterium]
MSCQKFDDLVPVFASAEDARHQERLQKKEIKRLPSGGHQGVLNTPRKRLFFVLYYLKTYPTFDVLGFHFGLSVGHAHDFIETYLHVLESALKTLTVFPDRRFKDAAEFMQAVEKYDEVMIDGVELPCVRPRDPDQQKDRYSGKKNAIR